MSQTSNYGEVKAMVAQATNAVVGLYWKDCDTLGRQRLIDEAVSKLQEAQSLVIKAERQ